MEILALDPDAEATSSSSNYVYDVALSWNIGGPEQTFVDKLCGALVKSGLRIFKDDDMLSRKRISKLDIRYAWEQSTISVIVLSKPFDNSKLVLFQELETIIASSWRSKYLVLPVYYDVYPSEIWNQMGLDFGSYVHQLWKEVSDLMAFIMPKDNDINEPRIIQRFVDFIQDGLKTNKILLWGNRVCRLMDSGLSRLPENINFPVLQELFLQDNYNLLEIPASFFDFTPRLQVLDMSRTSIKYLPPSISNLVKLQKLLLRGCKLLMELPPEVQYLKNLKVFDLSGTELIYIPEEIKWLHKLECLRMSLCACADEYISEVEEITEIIPKKTLSKLVNLKELSIFVDMNCKWWGAMVESIIQDLVRLKKLEMLKLYIPTVYLLQTLLHHQKVFQSLSNFRLVVGRGDQRVISRLPQEHQDEFETLEKCLKYVNGTGDINEVAHAFKYARTLFLDRHWTIDRLSRLKNSGENLRFCVLIECNNMKSIINALDFDPQGDGGGKGNVVKPVHGLLQYLSIHYMKNLKSIWEGPFASGSLNNLQILAFHTCLNLDTIFNVELLRNLLILKELIVEDCPKLESLVSVEPSYLESGEEFLPYLEQITLLQLPGLLSISRGLRLAPRLARMVIYDCPKLQTLSPMEISSKYIEEIKGESEWWKALDRNSKQLDVFVPLGGESGDGLMNQLAEARTSHNTLSKIQNSGESQELNKGKAIEVAPLISLVEKLNERLKLNKELAVKKTQELAHAKVDAAIASEKGEANLNVVKKGKDIQVSLRNLIGKMADAGFRDSIPRLPDTIVGFDLPLQFLKRMLLEVGRPVVVISAPGGYGKTVLATMICSDDEIQAIFGDIFFLHVSDRPDFKVIVEKIFHLKGKPPPKFHSDEDAAKQLEKLMRKINTLRVLLVLDDVLPGWESHIQKLMFQISGYKILVTTRYAFPQFDYVYKLHNLNDQDAMTLFHHSAFPQARGSDIPDDLVMKMVRCCKGFPLLLVIVGRCLFQQPMVIWRMVLERLSKEPHAPIDHLQTCNNVLGFLGGNSIIKEHYLDLGSFPKNTPIQASVLMDMWMELYNIDQRIINNNYKPLRELLSRNLIRVDPLREGIELNDVEHCYVTEFGLARELGIQQSSQGPVEQIRRLIVHISGNNFPKWWIQQKHRYQFPHIRLLSVTTDDTFSSNWIRLKLPQVAVLILNFSSRSYALPSFMTRMDELKTLIISNHGFRPVELNNFHYLRYLNDTRRIRLEYILIPSLRGILMHMGHLRKISLFMCEIMNPLDFVKDGRTYYWFPDLEEILIDTCNNLLKFPAGLCSNVVHLKKLSILNCHNMHELPEELGKLMDLESLKLRGCTRLQVLPHSIRNLRNLEVLDVSGCVGIRELPSRMGELSSLTKLNIRGCVGLNDLPLSFQDLVQLKEVECDEEMPSLIKTFPRSVNIKVVSEDINLD